MIFDNVKLKMDAKGSVPFASIVDFGVKNTASG